MFLIVLTFNLYCLPYEAQSQILVVKIWKMGDAQFMLNFN
jgi:hypothetical protein